MKITSHAWENTPGKICLCFKPMKDIKIADPVLSINSIYDEVIF